MYIPKHFKLYELLPARIYNQINHAIAWYLFDERILKAADLLRGRYGKMIINDWYWGGENHYRGWRPPDCTVGAKYSQHRFGRALDLIPVENNVEEIRQDIIASPESFDYLITTVEVGVSWLHIDCRNWNVAKAGIKIIMP